MHVRGLSLILLAAACLGTIPLACKTQSPPAAKVHFWHTFSAGEAQVLNQALSEWQPKPPLAVEPAQETFGRGQTALRAILQAGTACPDLARIDATWLPGLARDRLLAPLPPDAAPTRPWLPAAVKLTEYGGARYGLPLTIDGLTLIYRKHAVASAVSTWPPATLSELVAAGHRLKSQTDYGFTVRVDGYWVIPFLRQWGTGIVDPDTGALGIDTPRAASALSRFAQLFGTVVPPPPPSGREDATEAQLFRDGAVAVVINGPWSISNLIGNSSRDDSDIGVAPLPGAPLGGQVLVVPHCAKNAAAGWQLAAYLTSPPVQAAWARLGLVPSASDSVEKAGRLVAEFHQALTKAEPLPRHPLSSEIFEDLTPAVRNVVGRSATAEEALQVLAASWSQLLERYKIARAVTTRDPAEPSAAQGMDGGTP